MKKLLFSYILTIFLSCIGWQCHTNTSSSGTQTGEVDTLISFSQKNRRVFPDSCRSLLQDMYAHCEEEGDSRCKILTLIELGIIEKQYFNTESAVSILKEAESEAILLKDSVLASKCYIHLGRLYKDQEYYDSASIYLFRALRVLEKTEEKAYLAEAQNAIGTLFERIELYDTAISYFTSSIHLYRQLKDSTAIANGLNNVGSCYYMRSDTDYALANTYFDSATNIADELGDIPLILKINNNKAAVADALGNTEESIYIFKRNDSLLGQLTYDRLKVQNVSNIGIIYHNVEQWDSAIHYLEEGINESFKKNYIDLIPSQYYYLGNAYQGEGKLDTAILQYKKAYQYKDTLGIVEEKKAVMDLLNKYETEKKMQKIALQEEELKNKELKNTLLLVVIIVLMLVVAGITAYIRNYRKIQNARIALQRQELQEVINKQEIHVLSAMMDGQEQERKRIAEDLHDRLGSVLATVKMHFSSFQSSLVTPTNKPQLEKVDFLLDEAVREVRNVSYNLSTGILQKFGLLEALNELCMRVSATQMLKANLGISGKQLEIAPAMQVEIYRIMQEVIGNIMKHSHATEANIHINQKSELLSILVEDNGVGFDIRKNASGMGLKNMHSRIKKLGGELTIDTTPGAGTTVILEIPTYGTRL